MSILADLPAASRAAEPPSLAASVPQADLLRALQHASTSIPGRPPIPVLAGVLLEADRGSLTVHGWDYDQHAWLTVPAPGARGRAVLPARMLRDVVAAIGRGNDIRITPSGRQGVVQVAGDGVVYMIPSLPLEDYPAVPMEAGGRPIARLDAEGTACLARALAAASADDTLPVLAAVQLIAEDGTLVARATDRYRLTRTRIAGAAKHCDDGTWLAPRRAVERLTQEMGTKRRRRDSLNLSVTDERITAGLPDGGWSWPLVDGLYPKVDSLWPADADVKHAVIVSRQAVATAVRQVGITAERNTPLQLVATTGALRLASGDAIDPHGLGGASKEIPATLVGDPITVGFNPRFLLEGLNTFTSEELSLSFTSPGRPLVITGVGDEDHGYLLMPVRLAQGA